MALHWEHIKGFNKDTNTIYTFIQFQTTSSDENSLPIILTNTVNSLTGGSPVPYGHIVTNDIATTIKKDFTFESSTPIQFNSASYYIKYNNGLEIGTANNFNVLINGVQKINYSNAKLTVTGALDVTGTSTLKNINSTGTLQNTGTFRNIGSGSFSSYCEAAYFNATSDIRAKEDITLVTQSMLDIVNNIQIYTFKYKNNLNDVNFGVIAQELKDIDINGFSFVSNQNATGENNDFMSIRESKLVYLLIGAVKELSAEVQKLKEKLGE